MRKELPAAESTPVRALVRGLDVLRLFEGERTELAQSEIAQALDLPLPTVHRICATLVAEGFLARDPGDRRLRLGIGVLRLAGPMLAALGTPELARSILRELAEATGETASLATLVDDEVIYLDSVPGTGMLAPRVSIGLRVPAYCTALGKCLLAQLDPSVAHTLIGDGPYPRRTKATLTGWAELAAELDKIGAAGVAVSREEYEEGLVAVSVPVPGAADTQPMAVDLSILAARSTEEVIAAAAKRLLDAVRGIAPTATPGEAR